MTDVDHRLQKLLRAMPPSSVLALPVQAREELAQLIVDARRMQTDSLVAAFEATLKHVPFPVRGIVKRVLL